MAFYEGVNAETGGWGTTTIEKNMFRRGAPTHQRGDRVYCVGCHSGQSRRFPPLPTILTEDDARLRS